MGIPAGDQCPHPSGHSPSAARKIRNLKVKQPARTSPPSPPPCRSVQSCPSGRATLALGASPDVTSRCDDALQARQAVTGFYRIWDPPAVCPHHIGLKWTHQPLQLWALTPGGGYLCLGISQVLPLALAGDPALQTANCRLHAEPRASPLHFHPPMVDELAHGCMGLDSAAP